ncbi:MAG: YCF48-related protein, partial [Pirellulales bacterium]
MPALKCVKFFGATGWAFGESSALFPQGIAATQDGGRSWSPCQGLQTQTWLAGDFLDPASGALAGRSGTLAAVRRRTIEESVSSGLGLRGAKRIKLAQSGGWLVGDGDLVLATADLGRTWQAPPGDPRLAAGEGFDWRAVEVRGSNCWIAGSPGTKVLHSADGGRTWQAYPTGQTLPINALTFGDDQHGWAIGALGMVLATSDGGRTWKPQRAGGKRAALLAFYSEADAVPLELFARLCGNEGYLGVVDLLVRRDQEPGPSSRQSAGDRARAALAAVGVSATETAWAFPVRQAGLGLSAEQLADGWDRANDGQGI